MCIGHSTWKIANAGRIGGSAMGGISHLSIALLVFMFEDDWPTHRMAAWLAIGCAIFFQVHTEIL